MNRCCLCFFFAVAGLLLCFTPSADAQAAPEHAQMVEVLKYAGVENPPPADVDRLLEHWRAAQKPGITFEERVEAFRAMYLLYSKLSGRDLSGSPQALTPLARFAATPAQNGARMDLRLPGPRGVPQGRYLHFATHGKGPMHLLLLPGFGLDGTASYETFIKRNAARYTMHVVTFPFAAPARPMP